MPEKIKLIAIDSLDKVLLDQEPEHEFHKGSMLKNEKYSFQVAFSSLGDSIKELSPRQAFSAKLKIDSPLKSYISVRLVSNIPSILPVYINRYDENYISTKSGLFPDPLYTIKDNVVKVLPDKWQALWFSIEGNKELEPGKYPINITLFDYENNLESTVSIEIEVINGCLPEQEFIYTNWFHCDCIASLYNCEIFSETHWELIEKFIAVASQNGMNMILTPAFTPPLDTEIGAERETVQLVDVYKDGTNYKFGFDKFDRWIDICLKNSIRYFEHSHFFTQWGAEFAPKVMVYENDEYKRLFGWDTPATGEEYTNFLHQYIPNLISYLKEKGIDKMMYYHISDEPMLAHMESYAKAKEIVADSLTGYKIFDALSDFDFYQQGLLSTPVVSTESIDKFIGNVDDLWAYYTGYQCVGQSNRLISMPSARNRILGTHLYKYDIKGFLHWGYNFYYTRLCKEEYNPLLSTDGSGDFPSGTAYMVYPGEDGPIESLRLIVFNEALQDFRAMQLLESFIGKEAVVEIIEDGIDKITFSDYPHSSKYLLDMRNRINDEIVKYAL